MFFAVGSESMRQAAINRKAEWKAINDQTITRLAAREQPCVLFHVLLMIMAWSFSQTVAIPNKCMIPRDVLFLNVKNKKYFKCASSFSIIVLKTVVHYG